MDFSSLSLPYTDATREGRQRFIERGFINPRKSWKLLHYLWNELMDYVARI